MFVVWLQDYPGGPAVAADGVRQAELTATVGHVCSARQGQQQQRQQGRVQGRHEGAATKWNIFRFSFQFMLFDVCLQLLCVVPTYLCVHFYYSLHHFKIQIIFNVIFVEL